MASLIVRKDVFNFIRLIFFLCTGFVDRAVAVSLSLMVNDLDPNMNVDKWGT